MSCKQPLLHAVDMLAALSRRQTEESFAFAPTGGFFRRSGQERMTSSGSMPVWMMHARCNASSICISHVSSGPHKDRCVYTSTDTVSLARSKSRMDTVSVVSCNLRETACSTDLNTKDRHLTGACRCANKDLKQQHVSRGAGLWPDAT
jgi:hypothetical protein